MMRDDTMDMKQRWTRRDSKKESKHRFTSDNRRSVRWMNKNVIDKANKYGKDKSSNLL